jgi:hypothetical protein
MPGQHGQHNPNPGAELFESSAMSAVTDGMRQKSMSSLPAAALQLMAACNSVSLHVYCERWLNTNCCVQSALAQSRSGGVWPGARASR